MKYIKITIEMPITWWKMLYKYLWLMEPRIKKDDLPLRCAVDVLEQEIKKEFKK